MEKNKKQYEAPAMEAVEMKVEGFLCASGNGDAPGFGDGGSF